MNRFYYLISIFILLISKNIFSQEHDYGCVEMCFPEDGECKVIKYDKKNSDHMYELGLLYSVGVGVEKNIVLGADYYQVAAGLGHSGAQNRLCRYLDRYEEKVIEAVKWCFIAMKSGNKDAEEYFNFLESTVKGDVIKKGISLAVSKEK